MEKTTNYKLFKPELGDRVSIGDINENMDILDEKLKEVDLIKIDKSRILSTKEEVEAVTEEGFLVDALVAAQLNSDINKYIVYAKTQVINGKTDATLNITIDPIEGYTIAGAWLVAVTPAPDAITSATLVSDVSVRISVKNNNASGAYDHTFKICVWYTLTQ